MPYDYNNRSGEVLPQVPRHRPLAPTSLHSPAHSPYHVEILPSAEHSNASLNSSTHYHTARSPLKSDLGKATHASVDRFVYSEVHGKIFVNVDDLTPRLCYLPPLLVSNFLMSYGVMNQPAKELLKEFIFKQPTSSPHS